MARRRRGTLIGLTVAAVAGALALAGVALAGVSVGGHGRAAARRPAGSVPSPPGAPPPGASPAAPDPPGAGGAPVGAQGAVLAAPARPVTRRIGQLPCTKLGDPGFTASCGTVTTAAGPLVWLVDVRAGGAGSHTRLFRPGAPGVYTEVLAADDDDGSDFAAVKVAPVMTAAGVSQLAFGFHLQGAGQILSVDVVDLVDGHGAVVAHRDYPSGAARVGAASVEGWGADPNQSAGTATFVHEVLVFRAGQWRLSSSSPAGPGEVPASQL